MKRSKFSEEQILYAIRQAEAGTSIGDLCRQLWVSDATFYAWEKKYAHLGAPASRRLADESETSAPVVPARTIAAAHAGAAANTYGPAQRTGSHESGTDRAGEDGLCP